MYTLKSIARRGSMLGAAIAVFAAAVVPAVPAYADALNPLTERSLTLSSSSPGWSYLDASGNPTFAPPNSGANGNKSGNTFSFRVSSAATLEALTFQYCTTPAGNCKGPGNIESTGTSPTMTRPANGTPQYTLKKSDLEIVAPSASEVSTYLTKFDSATGQPLGYTGPLAQYDSNVAHPNLPARDNSEGNFIVLYKTNLGDAWSQSTGWAMAATKKQTYNGSPALVGDGRSSDKNNFITLTNNGAGQPLAVGAYVKVVFFATDNNYIINPGDDEFFVKINTYNSDTLQDDTTLVDGGVTVANVMNLSIEIQTKVLETMDFSVGTVDPNTLESTGAAGSQFQLATGTNEHTICDPIVKGMNRTTTTPNVLLMGNEDGEFSLKTSETYSTHSYWRLSSNSSGGATVYYSGVTLSNTVGDQINAIGADKDTPTPGAEQFGLALDNGLNGTQYEVSYDKERTGPNVFQNGEDNAVEGVHQTTLDENTGNPSWHLPRLYPLEPLADYGMGTGNVNSVYGTIDTEFAFDPESSVIPRAFAVGTQVLDCVTGKMRYIANIASTTPAGIYTTKINYIASPRY